MASTRMKIDYRALVYHNYPASGDAPELNIGTTDEIVAGLGGTADFELEADTDVTYNTAHKVLVGGVNVAIGSGAINDFIFIKNTGFQNAAKTVRSTKNIQVGLGNSFSYAGFTLVPGESILLHGLSISNNNLSEIEVEATGGDDLYMEVVYL